MLPSINKVDYYYTLLVSGSLMIPSAFQASKVGFSPTKKNNGKSGPLKNEPSGGQRQLSGENKGSNRNEEVRMIAETRSCIFG